VQTLSDVSNPFGTYIGSKKQKQKQEQEHKRWVGAPLVIHRRCADPMFSVSNEIAYANTMVQATVSSASPVEKYLKQSVWLSTESYFIQDSVKNSAFHFIEQEGKIACTEIDKLIVNLNEIPSLYVITPFRSVDSGLKEYIKKHYVKKWMNVLDIKNKKVFIERLDNMIGTIHTFQGKQADAVILLLGGNSKGAIEWVAKKPNMLNVAITRAKKILYVIGNRKNWGQLSYFNQLVSFMEKSSDEKTEAKLNNPVMDYIQ
jgi:hypothetical protein